MKKILSLFVAFCSCNFLHAQKAFVLPSPTGASETMTLYVDVNQTTGGLKNILTAHPDYVDSVYLWTWNPAGPVVGNGEWANSNSAMRMTHESGLLFSMTFIPTAYYNVDGPTFFTKGISCLAKLKSGYLFESDGFGEAKTEDLNVSIVPKLCDRLYCLFPEISRNDDYVSITYDNNKETNPELLNLGPDDVYLYIKARYNAFQGVEIATPANAASTPSLKMKPVPGQPGKFRLIFVPKDFFAAIMPAGQQVTELYYYVVKPGFTYAGPPPGQNYAFQNCE
jgi:hypothetical protein